ncbi:MAG: TonB-dependent receptor, partial [Alphaproteobacteria bacterium]
MPVQAQEVIEQIVVTAQKREQNINDVAVAINAFSGRQLERLGVKEPLDIAQQTPGLLAKNSPNGASQVEFFLRGVGLTDFTSTTNPSVGVYVDEVFKPAAIMLNFAVFDVERVEVLKGPQGTLYGRNSTAGAVNFATRRPTREFEAYL